MSAHPTLDYRTLIEQLPVVTYTVTFDDPERVLYVSPQVKTILGYAPEEYQANIGIWPDRIDLRDRPGVLAAHDESRRTGQPFVCDYRFRHRDGRQLWIHDAATLVRDGTGRAILMQGIMQDVTARRNVEQQLADAQALAHIGSWEWDLIANRLTWTDELYRIYGLEPGSAIDTEFAAQCVHPGDRDRVARYIAKSLGDGKPYAAKFRITRPDGAVRFVQAHATVEVDAAGHPIRKYGTAQDITERKRAELQLRGVEARYREAVENAVEGVFRTTPGGRFVMANRALAVMLGYDTPQQLIAERTNLAHDHYVCPEDRARFVRLLEAQGIVHGFEYEARRRDGATIWLRDHARVVHDSDGDGYFEGTVQDVTDRRRSDQLLDLRARQQAAVARLGQAAISGRQLELLLECAVALVCDTLDVEFAHILELRADGNLLVRSGVGWRAALIGSVVPGGARSQAGLTLGSERPIIMDEWGPELRQHLSPHLREHGVVSGITAIIGTTAHPYGVLGSYSAVQRRFTVDDVSFLQGIASILGAAVVRLRGEEMRDHLIARAISAHEEERARIARELHDETGQALSAILVGLRSIAEAPDLTRARALCERLRDVTAHTIRDVGRIARGLRPSTLDDLGLVPALQRYADELASARHVNISITDRALRRFRTEIETTLYRIIQEALTNVARHAGARIANVTIEQVDGHVRATVKDDGRGFDVASALHPSPGSHRSLGLVGMQERATLLGGRVDITSRPSGGVRIVVELPVEAHA